MRAAFLCTILSVLLPSLALSAELPHRKPGLWELTTQPPGMPKAITTKLCLDHASEDAMNSYAEGNGGMKCSKRDVTASGNQTIIDSICTVSGSTVSSHGVMTWTGDTAYRMDSKSHWTPPFMGKADRESVQDAKWTGPCPADMKPGDMLMPNGAKINVADMNKAHQH